MRFAILPFHLSKVLRLPRKSEARSYEVMHLSGKITLANLKIWCSKFNPSREISALTSEQLWWTCPFYWACHAEDILPDPLQMSHACHRFRKCNKTLTFCSLWQHAESLAPATQNYIWRSKSAPNPSVFTLLSSKCASCHHGVHFISTSKSGPSMVCFVHFHLQMPFVPQLRALFRHDNFQKCSEPGLFCTFWLGNLLRATTVCNFSSLIWPSPTFWPSGTTNHWKTPWIVPFLPFHAPASSFFWLFLFSDLISSALSSLTLPTSAFPSVHIVGSLTSKLPLIVADSPLPCLITR